MENIPDSFLTATTTVQLPHVAVCSSAGMGHLAPCLSMASALSSNCRVTFVVLVPVVSKAESDEISSMFTTHPHIHRLDFQIDTPATPDTNVDPFLIRYNAVSQSAHLLGHHLSTLSPPVSAVFSEFSLTMGLNTSLPTIIPNYTIIPTSARFFSFMAWLPRLLNSPPPHGIPVEIPGIGIIPRENIPPPLFLQDHPFTDLLVSNARHLHLSKGLMLNTFESFEPETLARLKEGMVFPDLPQIFPVGPLYRNRNVNEDKSLCWLDHQPKNSVIYVSFGSRTTMSRDQIRELGMGLKKSGYRFLWVLKSTIVDKEESEGLIDLLGDELHENLVSDGKGKLVKEWVRQEEILGHRAVGGFASHCGWNSVMEAARCGVPMLAWPQGGDQRENAGVIEKAGLGVWERRWGTGGAKVVGAAEIAEKVEMIMGNNDLRKSAVRVGEEAKSACDVGGSSRSELMSIIGSLKH